MRKRPASAMVESRPAVTPAAYEWDATGYTGLATETQQWAQRPHSQPFPEIKWGSLYQGTRVEWTLAESVDEVGGPQCVV